MSRIALVAAVALPLLCVTGPFAAADEGAPPGALAQTGAAPEPPHAGKDAGPQRRTRARVRARGQETGEAATQIPGKVEEVVTWGVRQRLEQTGALKNVVQKTEQIGAARIEKTRSVSLTEAMQDGPGVIIANECSMCGYKRIQLNGLKAEHTNITVDGLQTHTMLSGFYAVDAIPMTGVQRIEVARGAGASMTAPEAIGGVVNVVTTEALQNGFKVDVSGGEWGYRQLGAVGTLINDEGNLRLTLIGQHDARDQFDADDNGVSESPLLENTITTARLSWDIGTRDNLVFRLSRVGQEIFGGPMLGDQVESIDAAIASESLGEADQLFVGNDVRNAWIGNPWQTSEWIETQRIEAAASWLHEFGADWNMTVSASFATHDQESYYEGFDYAADDDMVYLDARVNHRLAARHRLTFGTDARMEELRSRSEAGESANTDGDPTTRYVSDSFDYDVRGFYLQDAWTATDALEVNMALRVDHVVADFIDPAKPGSEIDAWVASPRLDARYLHNDRWTSRLSVGRGYRAPLSFFETDHGILDQTLGFEVDIEELERSLSAGYALSYESPWVTATASISHTSIENLAALDETPNGVPLLTQLDGTAAVTAADIALTWQPLDELVLGLTASQYLHDDAFKSSFGVATIEEQVTTTVDWDVRGWDLFASLTWVGPRDLRDYGYEGWNDAALTDPKTLDAPAFYWVDLRVSRDIGERWTLYAGGNNIFNQTQAGDENTPLFFDAGGGYDVAYIYNLLRGRELYAGARFSF